jgi:hypothetical protein
MQQEFSIRNGQPAAESLAASRPFRASRTGPAAFRRVPVVPTISWVQGRSLLVNAAGAARLPAGKLLLPFLLRLPDRDRHSGIGDRISVEEPGKPGDALFILGKVQTP